MFALIEIDTSTGDEVSAISTDVFESTGRLNLQKPTKISCS